MWEYNQNRNCNKKNSILGLDSYQNRSKKRTFGLGYNQNWGQKEIEFKKKRRRSTYGLRCSENRGQKGTEFIKKKRSTYGLGWNQNWGQKAGLYGLGFHWTEAEGGFMASVRNRGQKLCSFRLAPICFGSRTGAEYWKQPLPKALPALGSRLSETPFAHHRASSLREMLKRNHLILTSSRLGEAHSPKREGLLSKTTTLRSCEMFEQKQAWFSANLA